MKGARLGGLLARALIAGAAAVIVVVGTLLTWPWTVVGPSADQRRIADLQRLAHAIDAYRWRQHILPASLARLPVEPAAPVRTYDPITNRPYDYRPLGPFAYELCARFDAAGPEEARGFWWHDGGRFCFSLEARADPRRAPAEPPAPAAPASPVGPEPALPAPTPDGDASPDAGAAPAPAPSAPAPDPPAGGGTAAPPGPERSPVR